MIEVEKAPPFATIQDLGWRVGRAIGLPRSGAMDPRLLRLANSLVGNPEGSAGIEWALGPGVLRVHANCRLAVLGAGSVRKGAATVDAGHPAMACRAGDRLLITQPGRSRFLYVAVRGGIDVPEVMGSRSTYLPGGFGGLGGRRLMTGDRLPVGHAPEGPTGSTVHPRLPPPPPEGDLVLRVQPGPQADWFDETGWATLLQARFTLLPAADRMGYRLGGPPIRPRGSSTLPSEAACPGAMQIPDDGQPIVLMPDGPTVGGYPKMAVLPAEDLGRLAQCLPGSGVRWVLAGG